MKKTMPIVLDLLLGLSILTAFVTTTPISAMDENFEKYETSLQQQAIVDTMGFKDFSLQNYPVAVYKDGKETVFYEEKQEEREPILGSLAATSLQVGDHYEVFMPDYSDFSLLLATNGESDHDISNHYTTVFWHEAFHAWQMNGESISIEKDSLQIPDENIAYQTWYVEDITLLFKALQVESSEDRASILDEWNAHQEEFENLALNYTEKETIQFYETIEGSAYYVESQLYQSLSREEAYQSYFLTLPSDYVKGESKLYTSGMMKYLLLDQLGVKWQSDFTIHQSPTDLLKNALGA